MMTTPMPDIRIQDGADVCKCQDCQNRFAPMPLTVPDDMYIPGYDSEHCGPGCLEKSLHGISPLWLASLCEEYLDAYDADADDTEDTEDDDPAAPAPELTPGLREWLDASYQHFGATPGTPGNAGQGQ